jgi:hypothetical protein
MNEKLIPYNFQVGDPDQAAAAGASAIAFMVPFTATLVYASVSPFEDDTGATMDIQDDTVDIVTAIDASDHDVPGKWISTHFGGTNAPVQIAAGSMCELDFNSAANANRFDVTLLFLHGAGWG